MPEKSKAGWGVAITMRPRFKRIVCDVDVVAVRGNLKHKKINSHCDFVEFTQRLADGNYNINHLALAYMMRTQNLVWALHYGIQYDFIDMIVHASSTFKPPKDNQTCLQQDAAENIRKGAYDNMEACLMELVDPGAIKIWLDNGKPSLAPQFLHELPTAGFGSAKSNKFVSFEFSVWKEWDPHTRQHSLIIYVPEEVYYDVLMGRKDEFFTVEEAMGDELKEYTPLARFCIAFFMSFSPDFSDQFIFENADSIGLMLETNASWRVPEASWASTSAYDDGEPVSSDSSKDAWMGDLIRKENPQLQPTTAFSDDEDFTAGFTDHVSGPHKNYCGEHSSH